MSAIERELYLEMETPEEAAAVYAITHEAYCREAITDAEGNELVTENSACPGCGERRMDMLEWTPDGTFVMCQSCGAWYDPEEA